MRHLAASLLLASALYSQPPATEEKIRIYRANAAPSRPADPENFTGAVRIDSSFQTNGPTPLNGARVTFEAGARTNWHIHALGQLLIVTSGTGRVQRWGDPAEEIRQGDIVWIPPGQKHWHGAAPDSAMTHIAIAGLRDGKSADWMERVTPAQYSAPPTAAGPTAAQRLMGDIAPKLADVTDQVLYADIWQRPQLSPRDRSLATVAALIAMNRPDQLRSHLIRARANGVTQEELVEVITHLAFYSGWPNAVTAVGVAREVFKGTPNQ